MRGLQLFPLTRPYHGAGVYLSQAVLEISGNISYHCPSPLQFCVVLRVTPPSLGALAWEVCSRLGPSMLMSRDKRLALSLTHMHNANTHFPSLCPVPPHPPSPQSQDECRTPPQDCEGKCSTWGPTRCLSFGSPACLCFLALYYPQETPHF